MRSNAILMPNNHEDHAPDPDSVDLVRRVVGGDQEALRLFVDTHKRFVSSVVWAYVKDPDDVQDLCQEIFIKVCGHLKGFAFRSSLKTWIAAIAINECRQHHRRNRKFARDVRIGEDPGTGGFGIVREEHEERLFARGLLDRVHQEISGMPPETQLLFRLRFVEEMDSAELSKALRIPAGTVRTRLKTLRDHLHSVLKGGTLS
jgi:RNA polymerase sigma-70 factor (ECF subfamily)